MDDTLAIMVNDRRPECRDWLLWMMHYRELDQKVEADYVWERIKKRWQPPTIYDAKRKIIEDRKKPEAGQE